MNGRLLHEGKTKKVYWAGPGLVILENKDDITKNDDPSQTKVIQGKSVFSTVITCVNFEFLKKVGVPVAYQERIDSNQILAKDCKMIPLEVVVRREAVGSFILRNPSFARPERDPYRFKNLCIELFLKTTGGKIVSKDGKEIGQLPNDQEKQRPVDDPLILDPNFSTWELVHPKLPTQDGRSHLCTVERADILPEGATVREIKETAELAFLTVEGLLEFVDLRLVDFKIEFGIDPEGKLVIADVIDNDSWRLKTTDGRELSKELFRQDRSMEEIKESYEFVANKLLKVYPLW